MEYRVEEIARAAGVGVDTVRFYQTRGLLPAPERRGRVAVYSDGHLDLLRRIRELNRQGLTLAAVGRVLQGPPEIAGVRESLLGALSQAEGDRLYSRAELGSATGIPEYLLSSIEEAQLLQPLESSSGPRYTEADRCSLEAARRLLESGLPLQELLMLARDHAAHTERIADSAVELFDRYVRRADREPDVDADRPSVEEVTLAFRELLPAVTTLVALHFQRTLIHRARARLAEAGDREGLDAALAATERSRLTLSWE